MYLIFHCQIPYLRTAFVLPLRMLQRSRYVPETGLDRMRKALNAAAGGRKEEHNWTVRYAVEQCRHFKCQDSEHVPSSIWHA